MTWSSTVESLCRNRSTWEIQQGLCGDVESEELRERAPDGLDREASHAGISEWAYGEFYLNRKEYGTVMSSEANEIGLEKLLEISWRAALQRYFDETMHAPATVAAYLAHPCTRTALQVQLAWCLMGIKKAEYEASNDSKFRNHGNRSWS